MPQERRRRPEVSDSGRAESELRERRLAEALRANLKRRKSQARSRAQERDGPKQPENPKNPPEPVGE
jgi:hypothetical protein